MRADMMFIARCIHGGLECCRSRYSVYLLFTAWMSTSGSVFVDRPPYLLRRCTATSDVWRLVSSATVADRSVVFAGDAIPYSQCRCSRFSVACAIPMGTG